MNFNKHLLSAQYIRSLGMKRASIRERRAIIHLLYTILRHKFKQQRIGKSLDDQQCRQLLWGTRHVLGLPPLSMQTHPAVQLCTPPFNTDQQDEDAEMLPESTGEHAARCHKAQRHTRGRCGQQGHAGCPSFGGGGCRCHPCFTEFHTFCTCLIEKEVPLSSLRRREKLLNSKKTTVDINLLLFYFVINTYRYL